MTRRSLPRTSSGVPSPIVRPSASTWMRSQSRMISRRSWSTIKMPQPARVRARAGSSRADRPTPPRSSPPPARRAAGSAARRRARGRSRRAAAAVRRASPPAGRASPPRPDAAPAAAGDRPRRRARATAPTRRSPDGHLARTGGSAGTCGRRPAARTVRRPARRSVCSDDVTRPAVGRSTPQATFRSVVLPLPLGPISPTISPSSTLQRHAVERADAAEALGRIEDRQGRRHRALFRARVRTGPG